LLVFYFNIVAHSFAICKFLYIFFRVSWKRPNQLAETSWDVFFDTFLFVYKLAWNL